MMDNKPGPVCRVWQLHAIKVFQIIWPQPHTTHQEHYPCRCFPRNKKMCTCRSWWWFTFLPKNVHLPFAMMIHLFSKISDNDPSFCQNCGHMIYKNGDHKLKLMKLVNVNWICTPVSNIHIPYTWYMIACHDNTCTSWVRRMRRHAKDLRRLHTINIEFAAEGC